MPMFNIWGAYGVEIYGNSEALFGFGLYQREGDQIVEKTGHHPVLVYFQLVQPESPEPEDPLDIIMPLAKKLIKDMPLPNDFAYPAMAISKGFGWQVGGYSQIEIQGKKWGYQTFTNADQSKYGVAYSPEGEYDKTKWAEVPRN